MPAPVWHPWMVVALPAFSLLGGVVTVVWVCALVSLLARGAVFGVALPANVPLWLAAFLLLVTYGILAGSLKAARHLCWPAGPAGGASAAAMLLEVVVGIMVAVVLLLLAVHFFPDLRSAAHDFPTVIRQAGADLRAWWEAR